MKDSYKFVFWATLLVLGNIAATCKAGDHANGLTWATTIFHTTAIRGGFVHTQFPFMNTSSHIIEVISITTSCGCTTAHLAEKRIQPGASGEVDAVFDVKGKLAGEQSAYINVFTDEAAQPTKLSISVDLRVPMTAEPRMVYWRHGENCNEKKVSIHIDNKIPVEVTSASAEDGNIIARFERVSVDNYLVAIKPVSTDVAISTTVVVRGKSTDGTNRDIPPLIVFANVLR